MQFSIWRTNSERIKPHELLFTGKTFFYLLFAAKFDNFLNILHCRYVANPANFDRMQRLPVQLIQRGLYGYYLNLWYDLFPKENILILSSSDMSQRPAQTMETVQEFLGVPKAVDQRNFYWNNGKHRYYLTNAHVNYRNGPLLCYGTGRRRTTLRKPSEQEQI